MRLTPYTVSELEGLTDSFRKAKAEPDKWCISGRCPDTNWGGTDRLHYRDTENCPPADPRELDRYLQRVTAELATARQRHEPLGQRMLVPVDLLKDLLAGDRCELDHHGDCQAHGYFGLDGDKCPQAALKELLDGAPGEDGSDA